MVDSATKWRWFRLMLGRIRVGRYLALTGSLSMGSVVQFGVVLFIAMPKTRRLANAVSVIQKESVCFQRVFEVLDLPNELDVDAPLHQGEHGSSPTMTPASAPPDLAGTGVDGLGGGSDEGSQRACALEFEAVCFAYSCTELDNAVALARVSAKTSKAMQESEKKAKLEKQKRSPRPTAAKRLALDTTALSNPATPPSDGDGEGGDTADYPATRRDAQVLNNVTFAVYPGQCTCIVGTTGSGKTTIATLAARLYDSTAGVVRLHGRPLRSYVPAEMPKHVGECRLSCAHVYLSLWSEHRRVRSVPPARVLSIQRHRCSECAVRVARCFGGGDGRRDVCCLHP